MRQKRPIAHIEPDLHGFSGEEIEIVRGVIQEFWGDTASVISDKSHDELGWRLAEIGEMIPFEASLIGNELLTVSRQQREWALGYREMAWACLDSESK